VEGTERERITKLSFRRVPGSVQQTNETLYLASLSSDELKAIHSIVKVTGAKNASNRIKSHVLACRMVQRELSLSLLMYALHPPEEGDCLQVVQPSDHIKNELSRLRSLPLASVKFATTPFTLERLEWARGDVPSFVNGEVAVGEPPILASTRMEQNAGRVPPFEAKRASSYSCYACR